MAALLAGSGWGGGAGLLLAQTTGGMAGPEPLPTDLPGISTLPAPDTLPGIWREGGNPAGLHGAGLSGQSHFRVRGGGEFGGHRRVQDPARRTHLGVELEGDQAVGGWQSAGAFHYRRRADDEVRWSAVADPFSGSPYVWADSTGGDWERDDVFLRGQLGSPRLYRGLSGGVALSAAWGQGARRNDPRPLFRVRDLELVSGVGFDHGAWSGGLTAHLASTLEEGEIGYFAGDDPFVYRFRGYGTFDRTQLVRATRTREGRGFAGGLQVAHRSPHWQVSGAARAEIHADSLRQGIARPEYGGGYRRMGFQAQAALRRLPAAHAPQASWPRELRWAGWWRQGEGTDPVFMAVNTEDLNAGTTVQLSTPLGSSAGPSPWDGMLHLEATRTSRKDIAADTRWRVSRAGLEAGVRWTPRPHDASSFQVRALGGYSAPLADSWEAGRVTIVTPLLVRPDFEFARSPQWLAGGEVGVTLPVSPERTRVHMALEVMTRRTHGSTSATSSSLGRTRAGFTLSLLPVSP